MMSQLEYLDLKILLRHFIKYVAFNPCQMISEDLNQYFFLKMKNERIVVILILSEKIYFISQRR